MFLNFQNKGYFYILTNADDTKNFKLVRSSLANFGRSNWEVIYTARETEKIEDVEIFRVNDLPQV